MKKLILFTACVALTGISHAQRTPADTQEAFGNEPVIIRDTKDNTVSEAVAVLQNLGSGIKTNTADKPSGLSEADYQTLITRASDFVLEHKYDQAIVLYKRILESGDDQYVKDRVTEANALLDRQQKEDAQRKKDEILRAEALFASSRTYGKHLVHFTGALIADEFSSSKGTSKAFDTTDVYSNFLRPGKYKSLLHELQKSGYHTLDGIAIPANTRLIVYKNPGFSGEVLLDVTGPAIINNVIWSEDELYKGVNTKEFNEDIQPYFPQSTRSWSKTNMHEWTKGSLEIRTESGQ